MEAHRAFPRWSLVCLWSSLMLPGVVAAADAAPSPQGAVTQDEWRAEAPPPPLPPSADPQTSQNSQQPGNYGPLYGPEPETAAPPSNPQAMVPPASPPTMADFESALDPYGQWVDVPGLGRVWQPASEVVGEDFQPYVSGGSWDYNNGAWGWDSQWDWGWAPFHYGRWYMDDSYGWVWWPSYTWGPAWVDWRCAAGYVAWAPLAPPGYRLGFALGVRGWNFASFRHFGHPFIGRHVIYPQRGFATGAWGYRGGWSWSHSPGWRSGGWNGANAARMGGGAQGWRSTGGFNGGPGWHAGNSGGASAWHNNGSFSSGPGWHGGSPWHGGSSGGWNSGPGWHGSSGSNGGWHGGSVPGGSFRSSGSSGGWHGGSVPGGSFRSSGSSSGWHGGGGSSGGGFHGGGGGGGGSHGGGGGHGGGGHR